MSPTLVEKDGRPVCLIENEQQGIFQGGPEAFFKAFPYSGKNRGISHRLTRIADSRAAVETLDRYISINDRTTPIPPVCKRYASHKQRGFTARGISFEEADRVQEQINSRRRRFPR